MDADDVDAIEADRRPCLGRFALCSPDRAPRSSCLAVEEPTNADCPFENTFALLEIGDESLLPLVAAGSCEDASRFCSCEP